MSSTWLSRLYDVLRGPYPLHNRVITDRLFPMSFRRFRPEDLQQCMNLYYANEPGRFPGGVRETYKKCLDQQSSYFLVLEKDNQIIASGGLSFFERPDIVVLCFGLISPHHQGAGIGTALLLARLALLPAEGWGYGVYIFAVEKSIGFYRRFGFRPFRPWLDPEGVKRPSARLGFTSRDVVRCRRLLAKHGISFPSDHDQIPLRTKYDWARLENNSDAAT